MSEMRKSLRSSVRAVWDTPEAETVRSGLSSQAHGTGFAKCIEDLMAAGHGGKDSFEKCAKDKGLKRAYKGVWGKPA